MKTHAGRGVRAIATGAALAILAACGSDGGSSTSTESNAPTSASTESANVYVMGLGGIVESTIQLLAADFKRETGHDITFVTRGASAEVVASLEAEKSNPTIDVALMDAAPGLQAIDSGLLEQLSPSQVPNLERLYDFARVEGDMGVMRSAAAFGLLYNTEVFEERGWDPPTTWKDLADPKFAGHVVLPKSSTSYGPLLATVFAEVYGEGTSDLDAAFTVLEEISPNTVTFAGTQGEFAELFQSGEGWIGAWSNLGTAGLAEGGVPIAHTIPQDGGYLLPGFAGVVKGAPNPGPGQQFLNFLIGETAQVAFAEGAGYGPVNMDVTLPDELAGKVIYGTEQVDKLKVVDWREFNATRQSVAERLQQTVES